MPFHQLRLRYFDHLLQTNMTAVASCAATALQPPMVKCRTDHIVVRLSPGARLVRVKALGKEAKVDAALTTSPDAVFVHISMEASMVRKV